jgi:tetratricopeptide (TPR) repeat protein
MRARIDRTAVAFILCLTAAEVRPKTAAYAQTGSQAQDPAAVQADAFFKASDWPNVAAAYSAIVQKDASNGMAWFRYAIANASLAKYAEAKSGFRKAVDLKFQPVAADIRMARIFALQNEPDSALALIDHAVQNGFMNAPILTQQPDFASIAKLERFRTIVAALEAKRFPCRTQPESRQLDFWGGSWNVSINGQQVGTNDVVPMLASCALQENWTDANGGEGKSFNFYDPNTRKWRQVWVADNGGVLDYTGEFRDGAMRFEGVTIDKAGKRTLQKLTFFPLSPDSVRQLFETSTDEGKTWTPGFDGLYVRKKK